jgi:hypothetical protein
MKNKIVIATVCLSLFGCAHQKIHTVAIPVEKKPIFLGWDENGHKKSNTTGRNQKISSDKNPINSTILNEDTIICEADNPLVTTGEQFIKNIIADDRATGTALIDAVNANYEAKKHNLYLDKLDDIRRSSPSNSYLISTRDAESHKQIEELSDFLKLCAVNKEAQPVEVIERKPISKIVKVKAKLNNSFYELWTYEYHLTFKP